MKEHNWMGRGRTFVWAAPLVALAGCQVLFGVELPGEDAAGAGGGGSGPGGGGQAEAVGCSVCGEFFDGAPTGTTCVDNGPPTSFSLTTALRGCICRSDTCGSTDCKAVCETDATPSKACKACSFEACRAEVDACLLDDGRGSAGGTGGGSGSAGASGAGGAVAGTIVLPPTDKASLEEALLNGGGLPKYLPYFAPAKWACSDPDDDATEPELKTTTINFHNGDDAVDGEKAPSRYCSNYNLSQVTYSGDDGWPLGAAAMKETLDDEGDIIEWSYYALKDDGETWYGVRVIPSEPVLRDAAIPSGVTLAFNSEGSCGGGACHSDDNTNAREWVIRGDAVEHDNPLWLAPNPYKK